LDFVVSRGGFAFAVNWIAIKAGERRKSKFCQSFCRVDPRLASESTARVTSLALGRTEIINADIRRPDISHVIFDFDGTLSWLRHGWPQIMLEVFLKSAPAEWHDDARIRAQLLSDILSLNGKPSIHQLERCCERARSAGNQPLSPQTLLDEYLPALRAIVSRRIAAIRDGSCRASEFIVWNAMQALEILRDRGVRLIILSGTVESDVRAEVALLGVAEFFGDHIYGSPSKGAFSKKDVIDRIMREERIEGHHLLAFGDGPVEISFTKAVGGLAVGVASDEDENGSHRMDQAKREHLIAAGADVIIPDYAEAETLMAAIFGS
jgi:phosphoglycolate phosphatase-like HAD superfamily hydrolase